MIHILSLRCGEILTALLVTALLPQAVAANFGQVTVKVKVAGPTCHINRGNPINVDFGSSIIINQLDGVQYRQPLSFTLECSRLTSNTMRLRFSGSGAAFDTTLLATDKSGLGIRLLQGSGSGSSLALEDWFSFTYPSLPILQAVPVKQSGVSIDAGEFSGTATLVMEFI